MSGTLHHSPAEIIRQLLIDAGVVEDLASGTADNSDWTCFVNSHPELPDNSVCIYNTTAVGHGREQINGETQKHYGIQVRVRGEVVDSTYVKARDILDQFESVLRAAVTIGASSYLVQAVHIAGDILDIGYDGASGRRLFTLNAKTDIRLLSEVASDFYGPDFNDEDFNT